MAEFSNPTGVAPTSIRPPDSSSRQKSTRLRLRSKPACNIELGPPLGNSHRTSPSLQAGEALLQRPPYHGDGCSIYTVSPSVTLSRSCGLSPPTPQVISTTLT